MTIWIFRVHPLFNFERLDMWCSRIWPACEKLWPFEFLESLRCSMSSVLICDAPESALRVKSYDNLNLSTASDVLFGASRYIMCLNPTSVWKVMTIWISLELPLFNFERLDIWCGWNRQSSEKLWPFEFLDSFLCSISSISTYYAPESDIHVKSKDHMNFSRASVVQFRASRYVMCLNRISEWKVKTIWISRELSLFNFERFYLLSAWIWPACEK